VNKSGLGSVITDGANAQTRRKTCEVAQASEVFPFQALEITHAVNVRTFPNLLNRFFGKVMEENHVACPSCQQE
jgi:hypothetical protein